MTEPTYTYRPTPAQLAERIVELATDAPAVHRAAREVLAAWDVFWATDEHADWTRFVAALDALREVLA